MKKLKYLTKEQELLVFNQRKLGYKRKDIVSRWGISERYYKDIILSNGGELNPKIRKYKFNEDYFENIDTEDKAYFLGFIVADGSIHCGNNSIKLIQSEKNILEKFKKYIEFEGPIYESKTRNINVLTISSFKTKSDLDNLGIYANKTNVVMYPNIPEHLERHFMRGVFDGDGCISLRTDKRDNSNRGQVNICSGSKDFIYEYYNKIVDYACLSGRNKVRCPKSTYYVIDWGGLSDVEKIYDFFYKDATVFLERKKETFDRVVSITRKKKKYRK